MDTVNINIIISPFKKYLPLISDTFVFYQWYTSSCWCWELFSFNKSNRRGHYAHRPVKTKLGAFWLAPNHSSTKTKSISLNMMMRRTVWQSVYSNTSLVNYGIYLHHHWTNHHFWRAIMLLVKFILLNGNSKRILKIFSLYGYRLWSCVSKMLDLEPARRSTHVYDRRRFSSFSASAHFFSTSWMHDKCHVGAIHQQQYFVDFWKFNSLFWLQHIWTKSIQTTLIIIFLFLHEFWNFKMIGSASLGTKAQSKLTNCRWNPHQNNYQVTTCNDTAIRGWDLRTMQWDFYLMPMFLALN